MTLMMILMLQFLAVDKVDVGLLSASQAGNRMRLEESIQRLAEAINDGLDVQVYAEGSSDPGTAAALTFDVEELRKCTAGAADIYSDCSDGTVVSSSATWWDQNQEVVIGVSATICVVYVFLSFL